MPRLIIIGGPSGVGKSTICTSLSKKLRNSVKINYYKEMERLGSAAGYTNKEILQKWEKIELELFEKVLHPVLLKGGTVILDTHFSFQKKISPKRAFEKGYYPIDIPVSLAHSSMFINKLALEKIFVLLICLISPTKTIIARKLSDSTRSTRTSEKVVKIEIANEKKLWNTMENKLQENSIRYNASLISNSGKPSETRDKILSLLNN